MRPFVSGNVYNTYQHQKCDTDKCVIPYKHEFVLDINLNQEIFKYMV